MEGKYRASGRDVFIFLSQHALVRSDCVGGGTGQDVVIQGFHSPAEVVGGPWGSTSGVILFSGRVRNDV